MNVLFAAARRLLFCAGLALPFAASADPVPLFVPFSGQGNVSVFDATAGSGGWVGSIDQTPDVGVPMPLSLVSVVLFTLNAASHTLSGTFEFNTTDLLSSLYGQVTGTYVDADILNSGGQFSVDYQILGGTGNFFRASGFGLSFVDFNPAGVFNNYAEAGLLAITVPEPGTAVLAGLALMAALGLRRNARVAGEGAAAAASTSADASMV